jgi:hypothetical protein
MTLRTLAVSRSRASSSTGCGRRPTARIDLEPCLADRAAHGSTAYSSGRSCHGEAPQGGHFRH